jgi:magnesium-protoporphyrin IX monomethyl ester (oxidative) cyclase
MVQKPPTGLLYLAANLEKRGVDSVIVDQNVMRIPFDEIIGMLRPEDIFYTGIYSDFYLKPFVFDLVGLIKRKLPRMTVVVGGPASCEYEQYHCRGVDIVCHGEGDHTVGELVDFCLGKMNLSEIWGISYLKDGEILKTRERPLIADLDDIPFPAFHKVDMTGYYDYHIFGMRRPFFTVISSRGCPNRCTYCSSHAFWGNRYRLRSVKNVVDELSVLVSRYGIRYVAFNDDLFGQRTEWLHEFIEEMKRRKLRIKFYCLLNPSSFKEDRKGLLSSLKSIGLDIIVVGLQSVDPDVLRNINRNPDHPRQLAELIAAAKRLSITTAIHFIYGLPGDSLSVFKRNLDYALTVRPHYALFYMLENFPGSEIFGNHGANPVTDLPDGTIRNRVNASQARFFKDPRIIVQNFFHVVSKNPSWLLVGLRNFRYLSQSATKPDYR